jgi:hypothetical protein
VLTVWPNGGFEGLADFVLYVRYVSGSGHPHLPFGSSSTGTHFHLLEHYSGEVLKPIRQLVYKHTVRSDLPGTSYCYSYEILEISGCCLTDLVANRDLKLRMPGR